MSTEEAEAAPRSEHDDLLRRDDAADPHWIDRVVDSLGDPVYITIDVDGLDPAIMPATGTPEPGGLSWYEILALLRATIASRNVVACDVVELSPIPGLMAPNFLCAKLIYKILTYQFASVAKARNLSSLVSTRTLPIDAGCIPGILPPRASGLTSTGDAVRALERGHGAEARRLLVARAEAARTASRTTRSRSAARSPRPGCCRTTSRQATEALGAEPAGARAAESGPAVGPLADARPAGGRPRRALARHRVPRPRP